MSEKWGGALSVPKSAVPTPFLPPPPGAVGLGTQGLASGDSPLLLYSVILGRYFHFFVCSGALKGTNYSDSLFLTGLSGQMLFSLIVINLRGRVQTPTMKHNEFLRECGLLGVSSPELSDEDSHEGGLVQNHKLALNMKLYVGILPCHPGARTLSVTMLY